MIGHTIHRALAPLVAVVLLASLGVAAVAAPAEAKPKCAGKVATKVGTAKGEVIRGTPKADVIVARGGHDIIYGRGGNDIICGGAGNDRIVGARGNDLLLGQLGRDKLFGGAGRDRLLGGPADDRLAGGPGNDACLQGSGMGLRLSCERPAIEAPVPMALAIAYSDLNGSHTFDSDAELVAALVDTNFDGVPSVGDTVDMGRYPTQFWLGAPTGAWGRTGHVVTSVDHASTTQLHVVTAAGKHQWWSSASSEGYLEVDGGPGSLIMDLFASDPPNQDTIDVNLGSPGEPAADAYAESTVLGDQPFIDVELGFSTP